ncbi:hypothetical protein GQ44DRAFT_702109 [Phaeosphaeriaceae sp. PMI808]|nr:hypothetical protein GQ44DRAFT_702109 [Phaeosphaeriaceae sp. PMI808]
MYLQHCHSPIPSPRLHLPYVRTTYSPCYPSALHTPPSCIVQIAILVTNTTNPIALGKFPCTTGLSYCLPFSLWNAMHMHFVS